MATLKLKNADGSFTYIAGPKGDPGIQGPIGATGAAGTNGATGWSPVLAVVTDVNRRVLQVIDWTGGTGTKPLTGQYVSATGLTATLANAIDVRGAAGGTSGAEFDLTSDWTTTTPATPANGLSIFSRSRARNLIASIGPQGQDTSYQPALFSNRIARVVVSNAVAAPVTDGIALTNYTSPTAITTATTNFYSAMVRTRYSSTTTAGTAGGIRATTGQWFLSSTPNLGGFFFVCRFGLGATTATNRIFIGMSPAALTNANPSTFLNSIGFGCDTASTTMHLFANAGTVNTANHVDLGANFPTTTAATYFYEARIFVPSGSASVATWSMTRLNDNIVASGTLPTAALPTANTLLMTQLWHNNGTTAAAVSIDLQSMYIETDN